MVTFTLPKLIAEIESFYQQANQAYLEKRAQTQSGFSMPDDPEEDQPEGGESGPGKDTGLYSDITDIAHRVGDPGLASELLLIAEMYKKALEIGGGYNSVNRAITNLINIYMEDEDEDEGSGVEDMLNDVAKDLRTRAGGPAMLAKPDSPVVMAQLKQLKDEFNARSLGEEIEELNNFQQGEAETSETPEMTAARMGQMSAEEAGKGPGRGWHTVNTKRKDWAAGYENERLRYIDLLTEERDPTIKGNLGKLINVLSDLRDQVDIVNNLQSAQSTAPDDKTAANLAAAREELKRLRQSRVELKASIRNYELTKSKNKVDAEAGTTRDPREQMRLQQESDLINLMLSTDRGKTQERNYRRVLVKSMSGGNWPGTETINKLMDKIQEASKSRETIKEYRERQAREIANKKQTIREDPNVRKNVYNWGAMQLDGFITHLSQGILAERKTLKDKILGTKNKKVTEAEKALFKPYMDAVADAANKKDKAGLVQAVRALRTQIKNAIRLSPEFTRYLISVRSSKFFYTYRDRLKVLQKMGTEIKGGIGDNEVQYLRDTIAMGDKLISYYSELKIKPIRGTEYGTGYASPTKTIGLVNGYLMKLLEGKSNKSEKIDPETGEVTYE